MDPRIPETESRLGAEVLVREARRLRRRRWLRGIALLAIVGTGVGLPLSALGSSSNRYLVRKNTDLPRQMSQAPLDARVAPQTPGALASGPNGDLYVADVGRDQILRHLSNGTFQVVAGNGSRGFSGDGGPAVAAALDLSTGGGLTVAKNGTVYFSDNDRVREVLPDGMIRTIAGGGATATLAGKSVAALSASLGSVGGLAIGPTGNVYVALSGDSSGLPGGVYRLNSNDMLVLIVGGSFNPSGAQRWDANPADENDFTPASKLAFDRTGDLLVAGGGGWGLYEQTRSGALRFVENFRANAAGASWGSLATDPNGSVIGVSHEGIQISSTSGEMKSITPEPGRLAEALDRALGRLPKRSPRGIDINTFVGGTGIAVGTNGTIYVDIDAGVWSDRSGILAISPRGHVSPVWLSKSLASRSGSD